MSETAINSEINYPGHKTVVVWLLAWHSTDNTGELRETSTIVRLKWVKFQVYSFRPADFFIVCRCGRKTQLHSISSFFSHPEPERESSFIASGWNLIDWSVAGNWLSTVTTQNSVPSRQKRGRATSSGVRVVVCGCCNKTQFILFYFLDQTRLTCDRVNSGKVIQSTLEWHGRRRSEIGNRQS